MSGSTFSDGVIAGPDGVVARRIPTAEPEPQLCSTPATADMLGQPARGGERRSGRERRREPMSDAESAWPQVGYALADVCCVAANGGIAWLLDAYRFDFATSAALAAGMPPDAPARYAESLFLYAALIVMFCGWLGLYREGSLRSARAESLAAVEAVSLATLLLGGFLYLTAADSVSRLIVLLSFSLNAAALAGWRYAWRQIVIRRVERGIGTRNVAIIGAGQIGQALALQLEQNKHLGYRFKGFLDSAALGDPRTLGTPEDLWRVARAEFLDEVFITIPAERELVKRIAEEAREERLAVRLIPELYDGLGWDVPLRQQGGFPVMDLYGPPIPAPGLVLKRLVDVLLSLAALIVTAPVMAILAVCILFDSPGPVFYRSPRVGRKGRFFTCFKLRTMVSNADELKNSLRHRNERQGPFFKISDDPRITRLGKWLRRYSLDELPQLCNVLRGDMSLVGPRPHPLDDFERYRLEHFRRLDVKPGLTGLWQVTARRDPSFETGIRLDLEYIEHWSLAQDLKILLKTVPEVFRASGS